MKISQAEIQKEQEECVGIYFDKDAFAGLMAAFEDVANKHYKEHMGLMTREWFIAEVSTMMRCYFWESDE